MFVSSYITMQITMAIPVREYVPCRTVKLECFILF